MTMKFLPHKDRKENTENADSHSGTFGCPTARATASQPKEPSFCLRTIERQRLI